VRVYAATKNAGKLRELEAIFAPLGWTIESDPLYADPVEGETSYVENAALKARALREQLLARGIVAPVVGDDSGLEVSALDGRPGVLSARYGAPGASWAERRAELRAELERTKSADRSARFVCALHAIDADGREYAVERDVRGTIAQEERGDGGFSYDALFVYPPRGVTFAELSEAEKNGVSHRAAAARALYDAWTKAQGSGVPAARRE
jgi:XTP/dITP diphosphohydrolase